MKKIIVLAITLSAITGTSFAKVEKRNPIAHDPAKDAFFSGTSNKLAEEEQGPQSAIVKAGECLKFLKEGEKFWTKYETEILQVESIGKDNLKVKRILFVDVRSEKWTYEPIAFSLRFPSQIDYEITSCPEEKNKLTYEEVQLLNKK